MSSERHQDVGWLLRGFLGEYLPRERNASPHTIHSYRDALKLLLVYVAGSFECSVADLELGHIDRIQVLAFLESLETTRGNQISTRNLRLTAIRSFFRFVANSSPEAVGQCRTILAISAKRCSSKPLGYLTLEEIDAILEVIPSTTPRGRRDDALVRFLYNTGSRVQEALDATPADLRFDTPAHALLRGKGRKERYCPLWPETADRLRTLSAELGLSRGSRCPLFVNRDGRSLTRFGVRYILLRYSRMAAETVPSLSGKRIHPHLLRHTTAMHLLQSGVDLNTVRCWLGHASVATTNRYVEADLEMKREALDALPLPSGRAGQPYKADADVLAWLDTL